ncbi:XIAP-associated factor 1 isoform B [Glycine soja]|nr:XIAP-associated factor 1 isoform B [Glycine soja]
MEAVSDQDTSICTHCDRAIPAANIDLHYAHCSRKLEKCKVCGDMVPRKNAEDHYLRTHAPCYTWLWMLKTIFSATFICSKQKGGLVQVSCSLCSETMERDILDIHKGENCPQRIVTCEFCEFPLPAIDLAEHQEVCGNRTELCHLCNKYVRLRERFSHEARCNGIQDSSVGTSRNVREAEREQGARRRPPLPPQNDFSTKRLLFTIAITGIAVILGSFFLQKKAESSDVH